MIPLFVSSYYLIHVQTRDELLPNTILSSLTRSTLDHMPLRIDVATAIPKSCLFRFENYWIQSPGFTDTVSTTWACRTPNSNTAAILAAKLKNTRTALGAWCKTFASISQQECDCRIVINLLDYVEECRALQPAEACLRTVITNLLHRVTRAKLSI